MNHQLRVLKVVLVAIADVVGELPNLRTHFKPTFGLGNQGPVGLKPPGGGVP